VCRDPGSRRTDDQERAAFTERSRHGRAERVVGGLARERQQDAAVLSRIDVGGAGAIAAGGIARRADDDIGVAVAVSIAHA